jgi:hypothetical protein
MTSASNLGDLAHITIRDLRDLEGVLERPIGSLFASLGDGDLSALDAETLAGLFWLRYRRDDPTFTYDDALDLDLGAIGAASSAPKVTAAPAP